MTGSQRFTILLPAGTGCFKRRLSGALRTATALSMQGRKVRGWRGWKLLDAAPEEPEPAAAPVLPLEPPTDTLVDLYVETLRNYGMADTDAYVDLYQRTGETARLVPEDGPPRHPHGRAFATWTGTPHPLGLHRGRTAREQRIARHYRQVGAVGGHRSLVCRCRLGRRSGRGCQGHPVAPNVSVWTSHSSDRPLTGRHAGNRAPVQQRRRCCIGCQERDCRAKGL